jgi:hypothetical protein
MGIRWQLENLWISFSTWRSHAMHATATLFLQRVIRGFLGRKRRDILISLRHHATQIQSSARELVVRIKYKKLLIRRTCAAVTIEKMVRGFLTRRRVQGIVLALIDLERWKLERDREAWQKHREVNATKAIQIMFRKYLRRKRALEAKLIRDQKALVMAGMLKMDEDAVIKKKVYRKQLEQWYKDRKAEHDKQVMLEEHTSEQKREILRHRQREAFRKTVDRSKEREEFAARMEAARVQEWLLKWSNISDERATKWRAHCWQSLNTPETPDEKEMRKTLKARAKKHLKDVLRRFKQRLI